MLAPAFCSCTATSTWVWSIRTTVLRLTRWPADPDFLVEKASNGSYFGVGANMSSTSFIGLRGKQEITDDLYAVFNVQTLFDPASGAGVNQIGGIVQNNGLGANVNTLQWANSYGDSSKAGVLFNNVAYFGVSSPTYGTFTMGRQSALSSDLVVIMMRCPARTPFRCSPSRAPPAVGAIRKTASMTTRSNTG